MPVFFREKGVRRFLDFLLRDTLRYRRLLSLFGVREGFRFFCACVLLLPIVFAIWLSEPVVLYMFSRLRALVRECGRDCRVPDFIHRIIRKPSNVVDKVCCRTAAVDGTCPAIARRRDSAWA